MGSQKVDFYSLTYYCYGLCLFIAFRAFCPEFDFGIFVLFCFYLSFSFKPLRTLMRTRNLYAGQEATVRTGHGTIDSFQIGKGVHQGCILSPCLFSLYAEYIMWNARVDKAQAGIQIAGRNINNLRYTDDTTLMAESKEELKSLLMKVEEEWKNWPKTQHSEN